MRRTVIIAVTFTLVALAGASTSPADAKTRPHSPGTYTTIARGTWVEDGCLPYGPVPPGTSFPLESTCAATAEEYGTWAVAIVEHADVLINEDGSATGHEEEDLYGADPVDRTCGSIHISEDFTLDSHGITSGHGTITGGTGDWAGSSGTYDTSGVIAVAPGTGGYTATWTRPLPMVATPCSHPSSALPPADAISAGR